MANGFKQCPSDECVFVKKEDGKDPIVVILYVMIYSSCPKGLKIGIGCETSWSNNTRRSL
jgi:hypothetical protein